MRYTERGQVLIAARRRGNRLAIEVGDSGPGIPEAEAERIFDEFYQLENTSRERTQGLGLGLAIVRGLCGLLHTPIELESKPGGGSRFVFYVDAGSETAVRSPAAQGNVWTDPDASVLVLDDDGEVREAMRELLLNWGFDALCVDSEAQALEHVTRGFCPDLVVSDYRLGNGANGIDAAQAVFARLGHETPLILVTGDTSPERLRRAREDGYTLLHKPVNPAQLRMVINQKFARTAAPGRVARLS